MLEQQLLQMIEIVLKRKVVFKNCAPFTVCISEINNKQIDIDKDIDVVMNVYSLIKYSKNYSQTSGILWQYYRDQSGLNNDGNIIDFPVNDDTSLSFIYIIGRTGNDGTKNTEICVPVKYRSNFWRTVEMPLINCEINLVLTWSENCILIFGGIDNQVPTSAITETKLYVPVVTL